MAQLPIAPKTTGGNWVQTEREAHEAWAALIGKSPKAAQLMHILTARVGENNAVIISQKNLMRLMDCSRRTIQRALNALSSDRWIEVAQVGETGTINAYILNDRIVWHGARDNLRYSLFSASVVISSDDQPNRESLEKQKPLRRLPHIGEIQMPVGDGLPPPSQPTLPEMEPDLPVIEKD
ncbi:helix-turn-helix domain-containing protein [Lactobacillus apis]|uniref:helix-turn-helix domain-containing protein n=1 Tax=Lactobacillus apis TaxID=303541 RepID=UPI0024332B54|nr:helix-turn-helix domain-containing protein [Lactobacillus apis]